MNQIITDEATKQIISRIQNIRHDLDLIEQYPNDFKYVNMLSKMIVTNSNLIRQFADTM